MRPRLLRRPLEDRLSLYPGVILVGPRQAGKTTLAREVGSRYFDLEQESDRLRLDIEWDAVVASSGTGRDPRPVVMDEAQSWPELFPRLRGAIDADRERMGRFLLLGSVSPPLMREVSDSLAGRLSVMELGPFLAAEVLDVGLDEVWLRGGYPNGGVLQPQRFPQWQSDYLALLTQRDLPNWGLPAKPQVTHRLVRMLAAVHGQTWNASAVASSLGISYSTVNSYLDYFEGAFLIRRLAPYFGNVKKRLVKSPKVYWRDSGLLHSILQTPTREDLLVRPWVGQSWEGFAIEQILGLLRSRGELVEPYFFRTSDGHEIDLVLERDGALWAIEVKLTSSPGVDDSRSLDKAADMIGATKRILVSRVSSVTESGGRLSCSLQHLSRAIADGVGLDSI